MISTEIVKTRQAYIHDLEELQKLVLTMGGQALKAVKLSLQALADHDVKLAEKVIKGDDILDDMAITIEDKAMILTAKQQPLAHDLRVISTSFKISIDLERIGDNAYDIAKIARNFPPTEQLPLDYIPKLSEYAILMIEEALQAYEKADISLAATICERDICTDEFFKDAFVHLASFVTDNAQLAKQATELLFICRFLKRIADHATNIAETIIFLETAERPKKV